MTTPMKRILVALDMTPEAPFVLAKAVELAEALGGRLRLLRVVPISIAPPPLGPFAPPMRLPSEVLIDAGRTQLERFAREVPEERRDGMTVEIGSAGTTICEVARTYEADLVIIGAHRHGAIGRFLGTTAAYVVNHIDRPVFVVRASPSAVEAK